MPAAASAEPRDFIAFLAASPTPYHAAREVAARLCAAGFTALDEGAAWNVAPGTRAYVVRGGTLVAFVAGTAPPWESGFVAIGAHTDSPNLRLKPSPDTASAGYRQAAIEVYGGVLLTTWLDRDLSLAGRVALAGGRAELVRVPGAAFRIPNLAIHLNREVNKDGLVVNPQNHLSPVWALDHGDASVLELVVAALAGTPSAGATAQDIVGFDLCLFDTQGATLGGAGNELLSSARLDNLGSCFPAYNALLDAGPAGAATRVVALYDHEEVGSQSASGARSRLLEGLLERLVAGYAGGTAPDALPRALARSLFVSCDMAHAVHPNYADKHDKLHRPVIGGGPVVKINANQSYATDGIAQGAFVEACRAEGVKPQHFVSRNDQPCGSTIGPITAARLGVRTLDVGNPMLAMHSCRETAGSADAAVLQAVLRRILVEPPLAAPSA